MPQISDYPGLKPGETAWEGFGDGEVIIQSECPDCDRGLLLAPARFCGRCSGSGYINQAIRRPTLADFLLARYAEEEKAALVRQINGPYNFGPIARMFLPPQSAQRRRPDRILAEYESKRVIVEHARGLLSDSLLTQMMPTQRISVMHHAASILQALALPYADHPDYHPDWRPNG